MTSTLLKQVERLRHMAILLMAVCGFATMSAQETAATSDEINEAIASASAILPTWTNDADRPWYLVRNSSSEDDGTSHSYYLRNPSLGTTGVSSTLKMNYSSEFETALHLRFYVSVYSYITETNGLQVIIDGERKETVDTQDVDRLFFRVPAGDHTVELVVTNNYAQIYSVWIGEAGNLASQAVKEGSVPLTITNDATYPWVTKKGYIQSTNFTDEGSTSKISMNCNVDKISRFSFECRNVSFASTTNVYVDGKLITNYNKDNSNDNQWKSFVFALNPGTHTVDIENVIISNEGLTSSVTTYVRNASIDNSWDEVAVNTPGQFVASLVDVIGDRSVLDVDMLKISGSLNDKDLEGIKQLKNIGALDLRNAVFTELPTQAFYGLSNLSCVLLPETLVTIGQSAFVGTKILSIDIPSSVTSIKIDAFSGCVNLKYANFSEDSRLRQIERGAFKNSGLKEFIMPDTVDEVSGSGSELSYDNAPFYGCKNLEYVKISKNLTKIPRCLFHSSGIKHLEIPEGVTSIDRRAFCNTRITSVKLPETLIEIGQEAFVNTPLESISIPQNVGSIAYEAFSNCKSLKEVTLNSHANNLSSTFVNCSSIETIRVPSVTPPTVIYNGDYDPFYGADKETVTVLVPEFALGAYKADSYWFQFRNIKSSEEISTSDFWAIHGHLKLNASQTLTGTPSIEIEAGGVLDVAADTPLAMNEVTYSNQEAVPAVFLNESDQVTAMSLVTKFSVPASGKWYFFSPVTDVNMADVTYPATDSWVIRYYDGARRAAQYSSTGNWVNMPADGVLKRGQGYIFQAAAAGTLIMPSAAAQHSAFFGTAEAAMTLDDNTSSIAEHAGWNLVGNPYPTYYDIYSMDLEAPITVWDGTTYRAYSLADDDFVLRPMQPFFVQKADAALTLGMPRGGRLGTSAITRNATPRANTVDPQRHKLNLEIAAADSDEAADYTRIVINEAASLSYEGTRDASKFMSLNTEIAQIYSLGTNNHPMAINERPYADGNAQLGVFIPKAGQEYRIGASRADRRAWLYDAKTGNEQDLTEGDYFFTADEAGALDSRFSIRFAPAEGTAVDGIDAAAVKVVGGKGVITVSAPADAAVAVYAADGSMVAAAQGSIEAAAGVYVVKVNDRSFKVIVK